MKHRNVALMVAVGAMSLSAALAAEAQTNLPPVGVLPTPYAVFKDLRSSSILSGKAFATEVTTFITGAGTGSYIGCAAGTVTMEFGGVATALSGQLERSDFDPANPTGLYAANPNPVGSAQSSIDPATGNAPVTATEGSYGWYAYKITALTGASATVTLSCPQN